MKKAPSYEYARKLMEHLQGDTDLAPLVMPSLFDRISQCDLLLMTANSQYCCVAVTPGDPNNTDQAQRTRTTRMDCPMVVGIYMQQESLLPPGYDSVDEYLADVAATIIARVQVWGTNEEDNQEEPIVIGVTPLDLSKLEKIKNLVGKAVVLAPRLFY